MPTNYTGLKTNTQAPSPAPGPEVSPITALPADGDPPNASTYQQGYRVLADFIDWLMKPSTTPTAWTEHLRAYRSAAGHKRFAIDHFGLPAGRVNHVRDDLAGGFVSLDYDTGGERAVGETYNGSVATITRHLNTAWRYRNVITGGNGGRVEFLDPGLSPSRRTSRVARIFPGDSLNDWCYLARVPLCNFESTVICAMEWDAAFENLGTTFDTRMGLAQVADPTLLANGGWFRRTGGNWLCETSGAGTSSADSGVAPVAGTFQRFRIVWVGASVDDSATARMLFFINGALVANATSGLPPNTGFAQPFFGQKHVSVSPLEAMQLLIGGPVNVANNTWQDAL